MLYITWKERCFKHHIILWEKYTKWMYVIQSTDNCLFGYCKVTEGHSPIMQSPFQTIQLMFSWLNGRASTCDCKLLPRTVCHEHDRNVKRVNLIKSMISMGVIWLKKGGGIYYLVSFRRTALYNHFSGGKIASRYGHYLTTGLVCDVLFYSL